MSLGKRFLAASIADGSVQKFLQYGSIAKLFKANEESAYAYVSGHVKQYGALPTLETVEAHTGDTLLGATEPADYYFDLMEARHIDLSLRQGMKKSAEWLMPDNRDPQKALAAMSETIMELIAAKSAKQMVDFRDAYELIMGDYAAKWKLGDDAGLRFGWPTLDEMSGGLGKGDMISFVGRPQQGKTFQMLYGARHGWAKSKDKTDPGLDQSRMFVSMEMAILPIQQRLAAMQTHVPMGQLKHAALPTAQLKKLKDGLTEIKGYGAPFYVVDGNLTATVEDIWNMARQLKPAAIFIDGAYLVKHPTERDRYRRVAENAELMKRELANLAPTVCSWQFAKTASKKNKKPGEKPDLEDIGYTDAIAQVSSLVLGLFEMETVDALKQKRVEILKGRSGETGSFSTRWDFDRMLFDEIVDTPLDQLNFMA